MVMFKEGYYTTGTQSWYENKETFEWESTGWDIEDEDKYDMIQVLDRDKHDNPTHGLFRLKQPVYKSLEEAAHHICINILNDIVNRVQDTGEPVDNDCPEYIIVDYLRDKYRLI